MESYIELREINKLIGKKFFIPSYQRGYRWDTKQVEDLLDDLWEFMKKPNKKDNEFYCLQPVVVLKRDGVYEVIDGQQRLTTIFIIQKFLRKRTFNIEYATRQSSKDFLDNIESYVENDNNIENIDYYFMKNAFQTVKEWFERIENENEDYTLQDKFNINLGERTKVIWYEVALDTDVENTFTRLNVGKIALTNAELIKALFLCSDNIKNNSEKTYLNQLEISDEDKNSSVSKVTKEWVYLRQLEIADEWDHIENALQNDNFWYFINGTENKIPTHIEYIFDAIAGKILNSDEFFTFIYFNNRLHERKSLDVWKEVKHYFMILEEWYYDKELYHLIGFLIATKAYKNIERLMVKYCSGITKSEFCNFIKEEVRASLSEINIDDLEYGSNNEKIKKILLLFNIVTTMNTSGIETKFPFASYVKNTWSLEHIHAQNAEGLSKKEQWISWIDEQIKSFKAFNDKKYVEVVNKLKDVDKDKLDFNSFETLFNAISNDIKDDYGIDLHSIDNIALLDKDTNSALNNEFFDAKRRIIIQRDREGKFIPICTRNVFLKYYSENAVQIHYWSESDREDYYNRICSDLEEYLPAKEEEKIG